MMTYTRRPSATRLLLRVGAALLLVCSAHVSGRTREGERPARVRLGREFKLRAGQRAVVEGEGLKVRFASVVSDSRCPPGVTCVWAGNAEVLVEADGGGSAAGLRLNTHGGAEMPKEARHRQYVVALVALTPRPRGSGGTKAADYVATLVIRKA